MGPSTIMQLLYYFIFSTHLDTFTHVKKPFRDNIYMYPFHTTEERFAMHKKLYYEKAEDFHYLNLLHLAIDIILWILDNI